MRNGSVKPRGKDFAKQMQVVLLGGRGKPSIDKMGSLLDLFSLTKRSTMVKGYSMILVPRVQNEASVIDRNVSSHQYHILYLLL